MGKSATAKKRARKAEQQAALRRRVYIALPEEFVDSRGEAWSVTRSTGLEELGLDEVLCHTLRVGPYDNSAETFRGLELQQEIQALDEDADCIMLWEADFDWMVEHFRKITHSGTWIPTDFAFLVKYLEKARRTTPPSSEELEEDSKTGKTED